MSDFAQQRRMMVDGQLRTYDVTDPSLLIAMGSVPRELFVADPATAYSDRPVAMAAGAGRRMMTPMVFARLVQGAAPTTDDSVLVVGAGTGYGAAVLAALAGRVVALESAPALAGSAEKTLSGLALPNVTVVVGPLKAGHPARSPYAAIIIEGAIDVEPTELLKQLSPGGRLACVMGRGRAGRAVLYTRNGDVVGQRTLTEAAAPHLEEFAAAAEFIF
ncbi:MAG: protein-L-isoaspartate O-methyltransferase [Phenylobacterium sp.]|nr:protein-L-isoaspartate O-methyltransferase [Phenylobacterium sp.]